MKLFPFNRRRFYVIRILGFFDEPFCHSTILLLLSIQSHLTPSIYSSYNLRGKNGLYYIAVNYKEIRVEIQMHKQKERHVEPRNGFF